MRELTGLAFTVPIRRMVQPAQNCASSTRADRCPRATKTASSTELRVADPDLGGRSGRCHRRRLWPASNTLEERWLSLGPRVSIGAIRRPGTYCPPPRRPGRRAPRFQCCPPVSGHDHLRTPATAEGACASGAGAPASRAASGSARWRASQPKRPVLDVEGEAGRSAGDRPRDPLRGGPDPEGGRRTHGARARHGGRPRGRSADLEEGYLL